MTSPLFIVIMIGVISLIALETVWYWHRGTRGTWREWPAGRSLMYLLLIIGVGFGYGVVNQFLGQYGARPVIGFGLYLGFTAALIVIRLTIRAELRRGRSPLKTKLPTTTGANDIIVATKNEESIMTEYDAPETAKDLESNLSADIDVPGPDHRAVVVPTAPNKAFWRTVLQVGPAALLALVGILPLVIQEIVNGFGQHLPESLRLWLLGAALVLTAASATIARIMALGPVIAWTRQYAPFFAPQKSS